MARGFLAGVIWGVVVSGVGAAGLSLAVGDMGPRTGQTSAEDNAVTSGNDQVAMSADPGMSPQGENESSSLGQGTPEGGGAPAGVTSESDAKVQALVVPESASAPEAAETAPNPPTAPDPATSGPRAPASDTGVSPQASPETVLSAPAVPDTPGETTSPLNDPVVSDEAQAGLPTPPVVDDEIVILIPEASEPDTPVALAPVTSEPMPPAQDETPTANTTPASVPEIAENTSESPLAGALSEDDAQRPAIGRPGVSLIDRTPAVQESRLPTIGANEDAVPETSETPSSVGGVSPDSPLMRFAADVDIAADIPRMAVVLIDDGSSPMGPEAFEPLPFPVSFALAPNHPNVTAAMQGYRARGFEVLAMASVPDGARASDVEVALVGLLDTVPEAVAVIESPDGGLQGSRDVSEQATAFLLQSGHGLVLTPKGLDTARKTALKEGVPAVTLFRDIDGEGQDPGLIRRALDQASFRARQEGGVVMLGRVRANTVSALVQWGLQDRGNEITLVPVSTVLVEQLAAN